MSKICEKLHRIFEKERMHKYPIDFNAIPLNGLYVVFELGEHGHGTMRIVRVGTHTGDNNLPKRLKEHFIKENKDRSIFRKNIGLCMLNKSNDPYLEVWNKDMTPRQNREKYSHLINSERQEKIEKSVSEYIRTNLKIIVLTVDQKETRLELESRIASTVSLCEKCGPSKDWLGLHSPKRKIRESGLWQVNGLYGEPLTESGLKIIEHC